MDLWTIAALIQPGALLAVIWYLLTRRMDGWDKGIAAAKNTADLGVKWRRNPPHKFTSMKLFAFSKIDSLQHT